MTRLRAAGLLFLAAPLLLVPRSAFSQRETMLKAIAADYPPEKNGVLPSTDEWGDKCQASLPDSIAVVADTLRSQPMLETWQAGPFGPRWGLAVFYHERRSPSDTLRARVLAVSCDEELLAQVGSYVFSIMRSALRAPHHFPLQSYSQEASVFVLRRGTLIPAVLVEANGRRGVIDQSTFLDSIARDSVADARATRDAAARREAARVARIRAKGFPPAISNALVARRLTIGMTAEMVRLAWGEPTAIAETVTAAGKTERWVYGYRSATLVNGKVTEFSTVR